jgi:hypothetical protein
MFERLPGLKKLLRSSARQPHLIGLAIAVVCTAGLLVAVLTKVIPFVAITVAGLIATALLIFGDFQDGERDQPGQEDPTPEPVRAHQVEPSPEHRAQRL